MKGLLGTGQAQFVCVWREKETGSEQERRHWSDGLIVPVNVSALLCMWPWVYKNVSATCVLKHGKLGPVLCLIVLPLQPANERDEVGGKAWWRHGLVEPESSTQDDGKAMALINWLWLVGWALVNHYPCARSQSQQAWEGQQSGGIPAENRVIKRQEGQQALLQYENPACPHALVFFHPF